MASDKSWRMLEDMFGTAERASMQDIYAPPESPPDDEARRVMRKMNAGETLTREEVLKLPKRFQEFYYVKSDAELESPRLQKLFKRRSYIEAAKKVHEKEKLIYEKALRKIRGSMTLTPQELAVYKKFSARLCLMDAKEVKISAVDVLDDVVKGDYTLEDVNLLRKGAVEASPVQLLEKVVEDTKRRTQSQLNSTDTSQFFQNVDSDAFDRITPIQLDSILASCTTGIDMLNEGGFDENEAKDACYSFVKALAMQEGENKIKSAIDEAKKQQNKNIEKLAEAGAAAAVANDDEMEDPTEVKKKPRDLGFNITNTSFDFSFMPTEDENVEKPLEIISYIGMTE